MIDKIPSQKLPIGYWLKEVDRRLTEQIDHTQVVNGVSRTEWQVLNLVAGSGRITSADLFTTMQTFVDEAKFQATLNHLSEQGWIREENGRSCWQLTEASQKQHGRIFTTQKEVRQRAMQGIRAEDYAIVMNVLQQMVQNLEQLEIGFSRVEP